MHRLRRSRWLTWALLTTFALLTAAAGAAPLLRPVPAFERLCSASGPGRLVPVVVEGSTTPAIAHGADCALCVPAFAPPPAACNVAAVRAPFAQPPDSPPPVWRVTQRSSPPPARAPPAG